MLVALLFDALCCYCHVVPSCFWLSLCISWLLLRHLLDSRCYCVLLWGTAGSLSEVCCLTDCVRSLQQGSRFRSPEQQHSSIMFTNDRRQAERTGKSGTPRQQHLQDLVVRFQSSQSSEEDKEKIVANLANFAYDPYNYPSLRALNALELFIDCLSEPNERLIEFGAGGLCNALADPANARVVADCGGVEGMVGCLSSPVRNSVRYAIAGIYYLLESGVCDRKQVLREEVVELLRKYADFGGGGGGFGNLARVLLDKYAPES